MKLAIDTKLRTVFPSVSYKLSYRSKTGNKNCILDVLKEMAICNEMEFRIM